MQEHFHILILNLSSFLFESFDHTSALSRIQTVLSDLYQIWPVVSVWWMPPIYEEVRGHPCLSETLIHKNVTKQ